MAKTCQTLFRNTEDVDISVAAEETFIKTLPCLKFYLSKTNAIKVFKIDNFIYAQTVLCLKFRVIIPLLQQVTEK